MLGSFVLTLLLYLTDCAPRPQAFSGNGWACVFAECINFFLFSSELYEKECGGKTMVYWEVKYPFPMSNRDVSFPAVRRRGAPWPVMPGWPAMLVWPAGVETLSSILAEASAEAAASCVASRDLRV